MTQEDQNYIRINTAIYGERVRALQTVTAKHFNMNVEALTKHCRRREIVTARYITYYLCRKLFQGASLKIIGILTGNGKAFDHAAVLHGVKKIDTLMNFRNKQGAYIYPSLRRDVQVILGNYYADRGMISMELDMEEFALHHGDFLN